MFVFFILSLFTFKFKKNNNIVRVFVSIELNLIVVTSKQNCVPLKLITLITVNYWYYIVLLRT